MSLHISKGNTKIGNIANVSLPPGLSCRKDVPCFMEGCYARSAFRMYPTVRKAWTENLEYYQEFPDKYFKGVAEAAKYYTLFRWHVSGDIVDEKYLEGMKQVALSCPNTRFLCFTKRYDYDYSGIPENLIIVLSTWPGLELPNNDSLPWAWLMNDVRRPLNGMYLVCPGNCSVCENKCWNLIDKDIPVVFQKH